MKIVSLTFLLILAPCTLPLFAQAPAPAKDLSQASATGPLVVDAHASPYRGTVWTHMNLGHERFDMRDATILDLIGFAYTREETAILGGPSWIGFDHFDIVASVPSLKLPAVKPDPDNILPQADPYDPVRPIVKRALEERFHLKYHTEQRPLPGYIMTVAKEGLKIAEAKDQTSPPACHNAQDKATPGQAILTCTSETITQFIKTFGGIYPHPVIDRTGLTMAYDFALKFNFANANVNTREAWLRTYTDVFSKQMGLVVAAADVAQPAMVVDSVDRPTPTPPDIAKLIPALPDLEFEVATVKPAAPTEPQMVRPAGSQITFSNMSLQELFVLAWQLPTGAMLGNAPTWINQTKYTILVKLPPDIDARAVWQNQDQVDNMLQKLLTDRFKMKYHWGEQTQDGYVLLAGTPKMKKADPASHSVCAFGPPPGGTDVRNNPNTPFDHECYCQKVTMDQFADVAQPLTGSDIKNRVANKTGLAGSYDFTLDYTSARKLRTDAATADAAAKEAGDATAAPPGGLSLVDAFRKELGLRLEKQPGTYPALILDHIEQTPTEN